MSADATAALRALADGPVKRARNSKAPCDDAAWLADVRTYAELAPLVRAATRKLEAIKDKLKAEIRARGGEGCEIITTAGIIGLEGVDIPEAEKPRKAFRRQTLTFRGGK